MKNTYLTIAISLFLHFAASAGGLKNSKLTFTEKDVFHSSVFLQNNDLFPDHKGQHINYFADKDHVNAYFTSSGVIYRISGVDQKKLKEITKEKNKKEKEGEPEGTPVNTSTVIMEWIGANPDPRIETGKISQGYHTYLKRVDTGLVTITSYGFETLTYKDVYPGIDVVYSFPEAGGLKYNFIVRPGGDPSQIMLRYSGAVKKIKKDEKGNVIIVSPSGQLIDHVPVCYTDDHKAVASSFEIRGGDLVFSLPNGYDKQKTLIIDPWQTVLTTLPPVNMAFNVDFDYLGNLFVYGAGATDSYDLTDYFRISKYDPSGTFLWTFGGTVASTSWNTTDPGVINYPCNFIVDRNSGKTYTGQGYYGSGTTSIRVNAAGGYDNFVSSQNSSVQETWSYAYNCATNAILGMGGGTTSNLNMGVINTTTGVTTTSNITGLSATGQDIACGTYDSAGSLYVILSSNSSAPYTNTMYKVNSTYSGYTWVNNSMLTSLNELSNKPFWAAYPNGNSFNCLAANGKYLFSYDGNQLNAYDLGTGQLVSNVYTLTYTALQQGGIAVDNCNNVYVGGIGVIKTFHFDGLNFNPSADISLGSGLGTAFVTDIKYNSSTNLLYASGNGMIGTYTATLSGSCNTTGSYTVATTNTCTSATIHVSPAASLNPKVFTYILTDNSGNIVDQLSGSTDTIHTVNGLTNGTYNLQVQWNVNCGGSSVTQTITINCGAPDTLTVSRDTSICSGNSVILTASATLAGGSYLWSPGGATTPSITVTPSTTSTYTVTYTPPTGPVLTAHVTVTLITAATVSVNNASACQGSSATLTATSNISGGTYNWSPGGATTQSITVSPSSTTTYTVTYITACGAATNTGVVTINPTPTLSVNTDTICQGQSATLTATPSQTGGTYSWSPTAGSGQSITVSPASTTTYSVAYTLPGCAAVNASSTLDVIIPPTVTVNSVSTCAGTSTTLTATPSVNGGSYLWSPGGFTTATITVSPATTTTYTVTYSLPSSICGAATASGTVTIVSPPTLSVNNASLCQGASATITATPSTSGGTYLWSPGGATTQSIIVSPATNTTYTVTYTLTGCPAVTDSGKVTIVPNPTAGVSVINAICTASNGEAIASGTGGTSPYTYHWSDPANTTTAILSGLSANSTYTVTVTDLNLCTASATAIIGDSITPIPLQGAATDITCHGYTNGTINVSVANCNNCTYNWSNGAVSSNLSGLSVGNYKVTVTDANGCSSTASYTINEPVAARVTILPHDTTVIEDSVVSLNSFFGPYPASAITSYSWTPALGLSCTDCPQPNFSGLSGYYTYSLVVNYNQGCSVSDTIHVIVQSQHIVYIPNAFTPNGNSVNDIFQVYPRGSIHYLNLSIFNRWGEKVFESEDPARGWDGRFKGEMQEPGVYVYVLKLTFGDNYSITDRGSITLIR